MCRDFKKSAYKKKKGSKKVVFNTSLLLTLLDAFDFAEFS